jgi:uncharacterized protein YxeA
MKVSTKILKKVLCDNYGQIMPTVKVLKEKYNIEIDRTAIYKRIQKNPSMKEAIAQSIESLKDIAEYNLSKLIIEGDRSSILFYLKTKGRDRGYVEKTEIANPDDGNAFNIVVENVPYKGNRG